MSFFDSMPQPAPRPKPEPQALPSYVAPNAVIPGSAPGELLLIRTEEVAVSIGGITAYPNGFEFTAHVRRRSGDGQDASPGWSDPFGRFGRGREVPGGDVLQLGLLYADGRRGAATGGFGLPDDPERLLVMPGGSGGSAQRWDGKFWVHPLPPDGAVTFVAAWPRYGVAEVHAEMDGTAIRAAAARAVTLWPEEPRIPGPSMRTITFRKLPSSDEPGPEAEQGLPEPPNTSP